MIAFDEEEESTSQAVKSGADVIATHTTDPTPLRAQVLI